MENFGFFVRFDENGKPRVPVDEIERLFDVGPNIYNYYVTKATNKSNVTHVEPHIFIAVVGAIGFSEQNQDAMMFIAEMATKGLYSHINDYASEFETPFH